MFLILFYIVLVIVRPQEYPAMVDFEVPILQIALVAALIAWLISGRKSYAEPQFALLSAFMLVILVSEVANGWFGGVLQECLVFGPVVVAFLILATSVTTQKRIQITMVVFVLCSSLLAIHGVLQKEEGIGWTGVGLIQDDGRIQYLGIFNDPNDLGLLFVAVLPMAFYLSSRGGLLGLARLFWLAAAALLLYGIYLTDSRGALLAVGLMFGVWVWLKRGLVTAILLGGLGLSGMMMLPSRLQELDSSEESAAGRLDAWYSGFQMFMSKPIFGVGAGLFTEHNFLTAHNSFVLVLAETGFVGFTIWLAFVVYCFRMMYALYRYDPKPTNPEAARSWANERAIGTTLLLTLCGLFCAAFFLSRTYVIILYFFAAMVVGEYSGASQRFPGLPVFRLGADATRIVVTSVGAIIALYLITRILL